MQKLVKFVHVIRNNWKKTVFSIGATAYGINKYNFENEKNSLFRKYSKYAVQYGNAPIRPLQNPIHLGVILNPASNKRHAQDEYEKYCAPLLHLAGVKVTVLTTDKDNNATSLVNKLPADVNAVLIAGGDGTVSEVITGLLRLKNEALPIGILPVGRTNSLANKLYNQTGEFNNRLSRFNIMVAAIFAIIEGNTRKLNVIEISSEEQSDTDESSTVLKPIYAVNSITMGAFRDAAARIENYWYFEKIRSYVGYIFNTFNREKPVIGTIKYTLPCSGCAKCFSNRIDLVQKPKSEQSSRGRWWSLFYSTRQNTKEAEFIDYSTIENNECGIDNEMEVSTIELCINQTVDSKPSLSILIGPEQLSYLEFIKEGWKRIKDGSTNNNNGLTIKKIDGRKLLFTPKNNVDDKYCSIDKEEFELKKMTVTLLNNMIPIFYNLSNYQK